MKRFIIAAALLVGVAGAASAQGLQEVIPGTGVTPQELAALNTMLKMGGMKSSPFEGLLENYYREQAMLQQQRQHDEMMRELRNLRRGR